MRIVSALVVFLMGGSLVAHLAAEEYRVEPLKEAAPADELAPEIAAQLAPTGVRVVEGENRTIYEIWPCKQWKVAADFQATLERLYPFEPGQLMGAVRLRRRGSDFREQDISRGVYTLRYALQPVDGNHVGTSPTRDFLLMVAADEDTSPENMSPEQLVKLSAAAAGSSHPAMLCLQKTADESADPALRHLEGPDWWVLRLSSMAGEAGGQLPLDLVVVGHAQE